MPIIESTPTCTTDFYPVPQVPFSSLLAATGVMPFRQVLRYAPQLAMPCSVAITLDGENFLHGYPRDGGAGFVIKYRDGEPGPVLRAIEMVLGARFEQHQDE